MTKRVMLSMTSSIFDPFGFAAPFMLEGRRILQVLCDQDKQLESEVSSIIKCNWKKWVTKLRNIKGLHVRRCMKPDNFGKVVNVSLHYFSDASELGYGQCSYIRIVNEISRVYCRLLLGKSKVVPKKLILMPRLELNVDALSVKKN